MLTPSAVANAKPQAAPFKLRDERGMYLLVKPDGARWWRFDYRRPGTGKRNTLSLGTFPDVSLKQARERRDAARKLVADGIDPGEAPQGRSRRGRGYLRGRGAGMDRQAFAALGGKPRRQDRRAA